MTTPWALFLQALEGRFGDHLLRDPMTELMSLKQTESFADYHDKFELLLGLVSLSEPYAISHFINGLHPYVQKVVCLFTPQTLVHACALARLQEMSSSVREGFAQGSKGGKGSDFKTFCSGVNTTPLLPTPSMPAIRSRRLLTPEERGHRCFKNQLILLEVEDGGEAADSDAVDYTFEEPDEDDNPLISIHALSGSISRGFRTMQITGTVGKKVVHILIDSGSTHNFLDLELAKRLGLPLTQVRTVIVDVADGNRLECDSMCKGLKWVLRNTTFVTDVLLLPLGNC